MHNRFRLPSPATVIATVALFVALTGTAVAAGIVPKAKLALNSLKLQGKTAAQVAALAPAPSSVASLASTKTASFSINAQDARLVTVTCDSGQKAISFGYTSAQAVLQGPSAPSSDGASWQAVLLNIDNSAASGTAYAVCLK